MIRVKWFSFDISNFCRRYHSDRPKFNKRFLSIWKISYNLVHGILTQPAKCRHTDKMITFGCPSWIMFGHHVTFNREVKCFTFSCIVLFRFWNLQQPGEQAHMMPFPQEEQSSAQHTCSEKHTKDVSCLIPVNKTPPPLSYTGLVNQGATCYLNTVLQILFMTEEFREAVEGYNPDNCIFNLNNHIAQLFKSLKSGERNTATTEGITSELKINVHKQEDAAKYLQKILNMVDPKISKIFQGKMAQITICIKPAKHHEPLKQVKTFFIISISLESQDRINMQSCFNSYFASIIMCGEGQQVYCKECKMMMDSKTRCSLLKVPSVLVLHLERFELDFDTMCCVKNESTVEIPPQLLVTDEDGVNHRYDLYAIANHAGSLNGGHYYAQVKVADNKWYKFDDSIVQQMGDLKCDPENSLLSDEACLLLYKKCDSESPQNNNTDICNNPEDPLNLPQQDTAGADVSSSAGSRSTADIFSEVNESERQEKRIKRANTWSQEDHPKPPKCRRYSEPESCLTNQQNEDTSTDIENDHDSDHDHESELNNQSDTGKDDQDQQNQMNISDFNSETEGKPSHTLTDESTAELQSNDGDSDNQSLIHNPLISSSADRVSEEHSCSHVSVELEPLNEDNKTQSHTNNNDTRRACCTKCSTYIISALLVVFLPVIIVIIGVIIYNSV